MAEKVTVKSGQTLSSIAKANNTTVAALKVANPVLTTNPKYQGGNVIFSGTKLNIPTAAAVPAAGTTGSTYVGTPFGQAGGSAAAPAVDPALAAAQARAAEEARLRAEAEARAKAAQDALIKAQADALAAAAANNAAALAAAQAALARAQEAANAAAASAAATEATTAQNAAATAAANAAAEAERIAAQRESIGKIVADRFAQYGLSSLGAKVLDLARKGYTEATITLELQNSDEYKARFAANAERQKKGLAVLSPAEYLSVEDAYRQTLRAYGLNQFDNDTYVRQFISNDVSPSELSTRVITAVQRVQNADPAIARTLRDYYGIGSADMVAYVLDPNEQLPKIQRQVAAAEIGAAARLQGLEAGVSVSEQLASQGITQAEAQKGYATIADILPTAEKLSSIYGNQLQGYNQAEAEQEVFNTLASAQRKRKALIERETSAFGGRAGASRASLSTGLGGQI
jgi:hypothetical protein